MKKIYLYTTCLVLTAVLCLSKESASAQSRVNPAVQDRQDMESIWFSNTSNAAGGILDAPKRLSSAEFGYNITKGDYKYTQEGDDNSQFNFYTHGGGVYNDLGGTYLWGSFKYSNDQIKGARWNASLVDPLRDEPFFLADENISKWRNQHYDLQFKAASPVLFDHLIVGVTGTYNVAVAAKQVDPRPYTKMSNVEVLPAIIWKFNEHHSLGANFRYYSYREDGNASNVNYMADHLGWEYVSPGFFRSAIMGSVGGSVQSLRNYNANALGGGLNYSFASDCFKLLVGGNYTYKVEDVTSDYTKPRMVGTVRDHSYDATVALQYNDNDGGILFATAKYLGTSYEGIEYFQTYDNTYEIQSWITDAKFVRSKFDKATIDFKLDYMLTDGPDSYKWKFGEEVLVHSDDFLYYVPKSTRKFNTGELSAYVTRNWRFKCGDSLLATLRAGYMDTFSNELDYHGAMAESIGYTEFTLADFQYATTACTKLSAELLYSFALRKGRQSLYVGANCKYYLPKGEQFDGRLYAAARVGLSF